MYDLSGGLRIKKAHRRISRDDALAHVPTLRADVVASAYLYFDAQADDARLTLAIARTAVEHGAVAVNHAPAVAMLKAPSGRVAGVQIDADGRIIDIRARVVVNAGGVWADEVRALDEGTHPASLRPAKGVHITVPWERVRNEIAMVVPVAGDRRSVFVVPWGTHTYIGTTDTDFDGSLDDPQCNADDVAYLLRAVNRVLVEPLTEDDIVGTWAGLRPLLRAGEDERTADLSRRHGIRVSGGGVVTITGGKLTTYRAMAEDTIDQVDQLLDGRHRRCRTKHLPLIGAAGYHEPPEGGRRRPATSPAATAPRRAWCTGSSPAIPRSASRWCPGCRTSRRRRCSRCATRWPARSTTCSTAGPGPGCWTATRRGRGRGGGPAARARARVGRRRRRPGGRRVPSRARAERAAAAPVVVGCP